MDPLRTHLSHNGAPAGDNLGPELEAWALPSDIAPAEDLTLRARRAAPMGQLPMDGDVAYERVFDGVARILHARHARHVFLVGERGVCKSAVLAEFAQRAASGSVSLFQNCKFVIVDCRYFAADQARDRLAAILTQVTGRSQLIVCLDGFASFLRGGAVRECKALLLSALANARCRLVCLLTPREYEEYVADDSDFADFFGRVDVSEPNAATAFKLLRHFAEGLARHYQVAIDDEAVQLAVTLSANYILNDHLPAKALKLLHHSCEEIDYARACGRNPKERVTVDTITRAVSEASGVPEETLRGIANRTDYEESLGQLILGQKDAVRAVATELGLIKAGMTDLDKPATVLLFLGQTGTGKTEMAKVVARFYSTSKRLKTYTLGNCIEPHSVSTIIGVPPGYVGNDQGGRLVNELNADPYCVFLLDEVDKAHPDVLQPFLNLFDEGWITDQRGARAFANKSIFILTSNVGQRMIAEMKQQGKSMEDIAERMKEALSQIRHSKSNRPVFAPEFLARIKRVIVFSPLDREAMVGISRKLTSELQQNWAVKRTKTLYIPEALIDYVANQAHQANEKSQGKEGGRIVRKFIADWIEAPIQRAISNCPDAYRDCREVALRFASPAPNTLVPAVAVEFQPRSSDAFAHELPNVRPT
jgi:ATP-dependent Clp protease ATP-binding subunit ClpA